MKRKPKRIAACLRGYVFLWSALVPILALLGASWGMQWLFGGSYWSGVIVGLFSGFGFLLLSVLVVGMSDFITPANRKYRKWLKTHDDPVFGPPHYFEGMQDETTQPQGRAEGKYIEVNPISPEPPIGLKVKVVYAMTGFTQKQRDVYVRFAERFDEFWTSNYEPLNRAYQSHMGTNQPLPERAWLEHLRIGRDSPDRPLGYHLSITYDQDEYVDVWMHGDKIDRIEFYM